MNDIRRTILWVIFAFSLVMLWDQWQVHNGKKPTFFPGSATTAASGASAPASACAIASRPMPLPGERSSASAPSTRAGPCRLVVVWFIGPAHERR